MESETSAGASPEAEPPAKRRISKANSTEIENFAGKLAKNGGTEAGLARCLGVALQSLRYWVSRGGHKPRLFKEDEEKFKAYCLDPAKWELPEVRKREQSSPSSLRGVKLQTSAPRSGRPGFALAAPVVTHVNDLLILLGFPTNAEPRAEGETHSVICYLEVLRLRRAGGYEFGIEKFRMRFDRGESRGQFSAGGAPISLPGVAVKLTAHPDRLMAEFEPEKGRRYALEIPGLTQIHVGEFANARPGDRLTLRIAVGYDDFICTRPRADNEATSVRTVGKRVIEPLTKDKILAIVFGKSVLPPPEGDTLDMASTDLIFVSETLD